MILKIVFARLIQVRLCTEIVVLQLVHASSKLIIGASIELLVVVCRSFSMLEIDYALIRHDAALIVDSHVSCHDL